MFSFLPNNSLNVLREWSLGEYLLGPLPPNYYEKAKEKVSLIANLLYKGHSYNELYGEGQIVTLNKLNTIGTVVPESNEIHGFRQVKPEKALKIIQLIRSNTTDSIEEIQKRAAFYSAGDDGSCNAVISNSYILKEESTESDNITDVKSIDNSLVLTFDKIKATLVDATDQTQEAVSSFWVTRTVKVGPVSSMNTIPILVKLKFENREIGLFE